jgi:transketolase
MITKEKQAELELFAAQIRLETLKEFKCLGFGHVGGAMSIIETLAALYGGAMNIDPHNPNWEKRDWLVVSKGHAGPALYAALALKGYFPLEVLATLNKPKTSLPSHCDRNRTIGIDMTTGSLGQGMSTAIGVALGNRIKHLDSYTYLILGDGECDEGQVWEGALFAAHHQVNHLVAFVDKNRQQLDGYTKDINDLGDLGAKFREFGWYVQDINGMAVEEIYQAIEKAKQNSPRQPAMIVLNTKKGQGCTFAENVLNNHHMTFTAAQADAAIESVRARIEKLDKLTIGNE